MASILLLCEWKPEKLKIGNLITAKLSGISSPSHANTMSYPPHLVQPLSVAPHAPVVHAPHVPPHVPPAPHFAPPPMSAPVAPKPRRKAASEQPHVIRRSDYVGVTWHKQNKKWEARLKLKGQKKNIRHRCGTFASEEEAARAWDEAARQHRGPNAAVNFPLEGSGETQAKKRSRKTSSGPSAAKKAKKATQVHALAPSGHTAMPLGGGGGGSSAGAAAAAALAAAASEAAASLGTGGGAGAGGAGVAMGAYGGVEMPPKKRTRPADMAAAVDETMKRRVTEDV